MQNSLHIIFIIIIVFVVIALIVIVVVVVIEVVPVILGEAAARALMRGRGRDSAGGVSGAGT